MNNLAPPQLLSGKTALITGAGQGLGEAIAIGLADAGARVVCTDIDGRLARRTADKIQDAGHDAFAYALDVVDQSACRQVAAETASDIGLVDILVNNAGIIIREGLDSPSADRNWRRVIDVNVHGAYNATQAWLADLRKAKGVIVNLASIASYLGTSGCLGYAASKGAILQQTKYLAAELAGDGIRVNAIAPGVIDTPLTAASQSDPERYRLLMDRIPMGMIGRAEDVVGPVVFLSSSLARYVTGVTLPVDGGFLTS
ncbi:MAG: glucose 1-dehydrogenase [Rhodobiaceae bacterium]|nr:glucose 1-dehydrogenase [Rhodobiaceae bacterium]